MKKFLGSLFTIALVIVGASNVSASQDMKQDTQVLDVPTNVKKVEQKSKVVSKKADAFTTSGQRSLTVNIDSSGYVYIGNVAVSGYQRIPGANGYVTLKTNKNGIEYQSTYRYINSQVGYAHVSNEVRSYSDNISLKYDFHYLGNTCRTSGNKEYKAGNCTNGYKLKTIDYKEYNYFGGATKSRIIQRYNENADFDYHFTSYEEFGLVNNKLVRKLRLDAPRYNNSRQVKHIKRYNYYGNGRVKNYTLYKGLNYTVNPSNFTYQAYSTAAYNGRGQLTSNKNVGLYKIYKNRKWQKNNVVLYGNYRTYHKNNRLKTNQVSRKSKYNNFTSIKKTTYRTNGKKYSYKNRAYKAGKIKSHVLYRYNTKGNTKGKGAYRVNVYFNKRGKATSAKKATYKKNGKLNKAKRIKVKKSLYSI